MEDGIHQTSGFVPTEFQLFRGTENFQKYVPNYFAEEKYAKNSIAWNKNRSKLSLSLRTILWKRKGIPYCGIKIETNSGNSIPNHSEEEKITRNSIQWNKNRANFGILFQSILQKKTSSQLCVSNFGCFVKLIFCVMICS